MGSEGRGAERGSVRPPTRTDTRTNCLGCGVTCVAPPVYRGHTTHRQYHTVLSLQSQCVPGHWLYPTVLLFLHWIKVPCIFCWVVYHCTACTLVYHAHSILVYKVLLDCEISVTFLYSAVRCVLVNVIYQVIALILI